MRTQQILVVALLAITLVTSNANAGFVDWLLGTPAKATQDSTGSFDQLSASIMSPSASNGDVSLTLGNSNAMVAASSPTGSTVVVLHRMYTVQVSGYNSEVGQTDDSPFITASGTHVRDGIVATNMFPFGTVIKMPKLYGDKIFVVEDRMNKRYQNNVDIWFTDHAEALKLGRRTIQIEVIK